MIIYNSNNLTFKNNDYNKVGKKLGNIIVQQIKNIMKCKKNKKVKISILEKSDEFEEIFYDENIFKLDLEVIRLDDDKSVISVITSNRKEVINYYVPFEILSESFIEKVNSTIRSVNIEEYFSNVI